MRRPVDLTAINGHLHCGHPRPRGVIAANIKTSHVITTHPTSRARLHRPAFGIVYNYNGDLILGARFLCGSGAQSVTAVAAPHEIAALCHRCEAVAETKVQVYVYYGADDEALYVGQTADLRSRHGSHRNTSDWFADVESMAVLSEHPDRQSALVAEALAIADLQPLHNQRQNLRLLRGGVA